LLEEAVDSPAGSSRQEATGGHTLGTVLGHEYIKAVVSGRALQINGDVGVERKPGVQGNRYVQPEARNESTQVNGATSAEALQAILKSRH
jgi:hypothetical protein